jgi:hypothetical protein
MVLNPVGTVTAGVIASDTFVKYSDHPVGKILLTSQREQFPLLDVVGNSY